MSLTIGPWRLERTVSDSDAPPATSIVSWRTTSGSQWPSNSTLAGSSGQAVSW